MRSKSYFRHVKKLSVFALVGLLSIGSATVLAATSSFDGGDFTYDWETINIGAGGFVTSLDFSDDGTLVVKTDVDGAYIWDESDNRMNQLLTASSLPNAFVNPESGGGVQEIVLAPSNSNIIYMSWFDRMFKSTDKGATFTELTAYGSAFASDANGQYRTHNDRIAVDPINPDVVYVGTIEDGLHVSFDGGDSFSHIASVPTGTGQRGVTAITFDRNSGVTGGRTNTVYANSYSNGLYRTTDAGASWSAVASSPTDISDIEVQANGNLYVAAVSESTVYMYDPTGGIWNNLNPTHPGSPLGSSAGEFSLALDPNDDNRLFVMNEAGSLTYTLNGGSSWQSGTHNRTATDIPWLEWTDEPWFTSAEIALNPANPNQLWLAQGLGVWMLDVSSNPSGTFNWQSRNLGIEELVSRGVLSIEGRDQVLLPAMDRPIFVSNSDNDFPTRHWPDSAFNNGWDIANSASDPDYVVAMVSDYFTFRGPLNASFSTDGGTTWSSFPTQPGPTPGDPYPYWGEGGNIAVGAPGNVVVVPSVGAVPNQQAYYTTDGGNTWNQVNGLPSGLINNRNFRRHIVTADGVTPGTFYAYDSSAENIYRSTDGGANWSVIGNSGAWWTGWNAKLRRVPGQAGNLFFTAGHQSAGGAGGNAYDGGNPMLRSVDGGANWTDVPGMTEVYDVGFGAAAEGQSYPSIFLAGFYNHEFGLWRSFDNALTWEKIGEYPTGSVSRIDYVSGDMNNPNCSYVGFAGSGWAKGCVRGASTTTPPSGGGGSSSGGSSGGGTAGSNGNSIAEQLSNTGTPLAIIPAVAVILLTVMTALKVRQRVYKLHR